MAISRFAASLTSLVLLSRISTATKINNDVAGEPQVSCTEDSVTFSVRTQNRFTGNIFIKGKYNVPQCRQEYFSNSFNGASFTVRIGDCGMRRIRQLQPHGMNYILVFVVNFHNQFITKVDRAYNVRCFYAQVDKTVTSQLGVSMIGTTELRAQTLVMPNCQYSVRQGTVNGPEVRFVRVGDRLVHMWQCDNPNFGMLVKNCFVNDGEGSSVRVLDSRGCPVFTPVIQGTLNYDNTLNLAYVEVWAYKFPDRAQLFFQCQIQVCNKRENECIGVTPPNCPLISGGDPNIGVVGPTGPNVGVVNPGPGQVGYAGSGSVGVPNPLPNIGVNSIYPQQGIGIGVQGPNNYPYNPSPPVLYPAGGGVGVNQGYRRRDGGEFLDQNGVNVDEPAQRALGDTARHGPIHAATIDEQPAIPLEDLPQDSLNIAGGQSFPQGFRAGPLEPVKKSKAKARRALTLPEDPVDIKVDDNTLDVASETVFVADVEQEAPELDEEAEAFAHAMNQDFDESMVCLNPASMGGLVSTFMMMILIILVLVIFIWRRHSKATSNSGIGHGFFTSPLTKFREHSIVT